VPHVWHVWPFLPETKAAVARIGEFVRQRTTATTPAVKARRRTAQRKARESSQAS
jgi:hypothetical protein